MELLLHLQFSRHLHVVCVHKDRFPAAVVVVHEGGVAMPSLQGRFMYHLLKLMSKRYLIGWTFTNTMNYPTLKYQLLHNQEGKILVYYETSLYSFVSQD